MHLISKEIFGPFKDCVEKHFRNFSSSNYDLTINFEQNGFKTWENINEYMCIPKLEVLKRRTIVGFILASKVLFMLTFFAMITCLCLEEHLRNQTISQLPMLLGVLIITFLICFIDKYYGKKATSKSLSNVKSLISAEIYTPISTIKNVFLHFKETKNIRLISVDTYHIKSLKKVTIHYVYDEKMVGSLDLKFSEHP